MSLPILFHGDVGGTIDAYGLALGMESLSGSPSSSIIWRRSLCGRLGRRAGDDGVCPPWWVSLGGEAGGSAVLSLARVGACADELRLMGGERIEVVILVGRVGGGRGYFIERFREPVGLPLWSGCEVDLGGTVRIARLRSW